MGVGGLVGDDFPRQADARLSKVFGEIVQVRTSRVVWVAAVPGDHAVWTIGHETVSRLLDSHAGFL